MLKKAIDHQLCNAVLLQDLGMANSETPIKEAEVR